MTANDFFKTWFPLAFEKAEAAKKRITAATQTAAVANHLVCDDAFLPNWPNFVRGVPNAALRAVLLGAIQKGTRAYLERQEIHAQEGVRIIYTGARLDQGDPRSLGGRRNVGCKLTAAVYFSSISRQISRYLARNRRKLFHRWGQFSLRRLPPPRLLGGWETVLHTVRLPSLSNEIRVTAYQLQKALAKTDTGINRDTLVVCPEGIEPPTLSLEG